MFQVTKAESVEEQRDTLEQNEPTEPTNVISEKNESNSETLPESMEGESEEVPLITSDVVLVGILMVMLAVIFPPAAHRTLVGSVFIRSFPVYFSATFFLPCSLFLD